MVKRHPPPVGDFEIEGTVTLALNDTWATVIVMDKSTFNKLRKRHIVRHMNDNIYPY